MNGSSLSFNTSPSIVQYLCKHRGLIQWKILCENPEYSLDFYKGHEHWDVLCHHPRMTPEYAEEHINDLPLSGLCTNSALPLSFFENRPIHTETMALHPKITLDFALRKEVYLPFLCLNPHLSEETFRVLVRDHLSQVDWTALSSNPSIGSSLWKEWCKQYPDRVNWKCLCKHMGDVSFLYDHYDLLDWKSLVVNDRLPLSFWEENNTRIRWNNFHMFSKNPGIMRQVTRAEVGQFLNS